MTVFLSHSKKDRELAISIATDLKKNKISVWFDEWEIFIGDSIVKKVQEGLSSCEFLSIIFTKNSTGSSWVEREWQSILSKEINTREIIILPIKGDDCEIPFILGDKLYADFSKDYNSAIKQLIESIKHHSKKISNGLHEGEEHNEKKSNEIEVKLNLDFDKFTNADKERFAKAISEMLGGNFDIKITNVRKGSVILKFKLPDDKTVSEFFKKIKNLSLSLPVDDAWIVDNAATDVNIEKSNTILSIERTRKTPKVYFDAIKGEGYLKGWSLPEDSTMFYKPIIDWIEYLPEISHNKKFILHFDIEYYNTSSSKRFLDIFKQLERLYSNGFDIKINWYYEEDDEDNREGGEDYKSMLKVPVNLIEIKV